ncbi:MAG: hypothetical protein K9M94_06610 [Spirochaetia bacterium]|nr:hypothetical protein [Spirochaetia bacterium]
METIEVLFLLARPGAGKSEIIDYLQQMDSKERPQRMRLASDLQVIDDFPMLWTWFEEDAILEEMGKPRLHTDDQGNFAAPHLWNLLIRRICLDYRKAVRDRTPSSAPLTAPFTALIEFSRGKEHGGYREAFKHVDREILSKAAILYVDVSFKESLRKNRTRFNPDKPDSILEHGLSDEKLTSLYKEIDWEEFRGPADSHYIPIQGIQVPFVVFDNEDDVTTDRGPELGIRLEQALHDLHERYRLRDKS